MKSKIIKFAVSAALVGTLALGVTTQTLVAEETNQTQALSPKVGNKLLELQTMVQNKNYGSAIQQASNMLTWKNLTPYEKVQIYNFLGFSNYSNGNLGSALSAYENLMAQGAAAPQGIQQSTLTIMAQLYLQQENFTRALTTIDRLMGVVQSPGADLFILKAQAHYQAKQFSQVRAPLSRAIDMVKAQGNIPKENWLLMMRSAYYEANDYQGMSRSIRELIRYYPKDSYILQLAGAYSQAGETKKQLALMEALYDAGIKNDADSSKNLAMLYLMHETPYKAGKVLEREMNAGKIPKNVDNLKLLANAWFQSRADDKAIPALNTAATQSGDPDLYLRLGSSYMNIDNYEKAIPALRTSLSKGVKDRRAANQLLGTCYLSLEKYEEAKEVFAQVGGKTGRQFLKYIDDELLRKEKLKQEVKLKKIEKNELLESIDAG